MARTNGARERRDRPGVVPVTGGAVPGLVLWTALAAAWAAGLLRPSLIDLLLAFGLLFVVPLGVGQARRLGVHITSAPLVAAAAALGALSLLPEPGVLAGGLAAPWLVACLLMALSGLGSLAAQRSLSPRTLLPVAALAYLAVGAGWLVLSRLGARPLGFSDVIVQLTAVHFHFAGFAAPLVAAATGEALQARFPRLAAAARIGGMGVVAAMPLVAAGFVASHLLSAAGASLLAASLGLLAVVMLPAAAAQRGLPGVLLRLAAASVLGAMALAVGYAVGPVVGLPVLPIPRMVQFHGAANAFGFCGGGLLAYALVAGRRSAGGEN